MRLAILLACALSLSACADALAAGETPFVQPDLSGSLHIPLTADAAEGVSFRLRDVQLELSGSAFLTLTERDNTRRETIFTRLPAGEYTVFLRPGWQLVQRASDGTETPATAELLSPNPVRLVVDALGDERLYLAFKHGEQELRFGAGPVQVTQADSTRRNAL